MVSLLPYTGLIAATACERLAELRISRRNLRRALQMGGREVGFGHYPPMVVLHTGLLVACVAEPWLLGRPFLPWLGFPMLAVALASQALRWWCIATLGPRWNTRVVVVPGAPLVRTGPYRWFDHPNYLAVVAEGIALPLVHTAWVTALAFTALNAVLLWVRVRVEVDALAATAPPPGHREARHVR